MIAATEIGGIETQPFLLPGNTVAKINDLETEIAATDGDADNLLWPQAECVYWLLKSNAISQRKLARQWVNPKTNKPYALRHVQVVREVFADFLTSRWPRSVKVVDGERPRFRDVYNAIANPKGCYGSEDEIWFTPKDFIEAAHAVFGGPPDLDPASCPAANAVVRAPEIFTEEDDGLAQRWLALHLWMNPPFSKKKIPLFCNKLVESFECGDVTEAIVLVRSDTSSRWWTTLCRAATAISLPSGRVRFWKPDVDVNGKSNFGTAIFYFGHRRDAFLSAFARFGPVVVIARVDADGSISEEVR